MYVYVLISIVSFNSEIDISNTCKFNYTESNVFGEIYVLHAGLFSEHASKYMCSGETMCL